MVLVGYGSQFLVLLQISYHQIQHFSSSSQAFQITIVLTSTYFGIELKLDNEFSNPLSSNNIAILMVNVKLRHSCTRL